MPSEGAQNHKKKRISKDSEPAEDNSTWECSMCTFRNRNEAFKCEICDTRKGTSTRKPRLNENVVERQKTMHNFVVQQQEKAVNSFSFRKRAQLSLSPTNSRHSPVSSCSSNRSSNRTRAKRAMVPIPDIFIHRSSPKKITITVNGEQVVITEFKRKGVTSERLAPRKILTPAPS